MSYQIRIGFFIVLFSALLLNQGCKRDSEEPKKNECTIKVIDWPDKNNDNQDFERKHPKALKANGKKDMVEKVLKKMKDDKCDCIKKLILLGHGEPGIISVGAGKVATECKEIDNKPKEWQDALKDLKGKFCPDAKIILFGCSVGKGEAGAKKLKAVADYFEVTVSGPSKDVYASQDPESTSDQTAKPNKELKPKGDDTPGKRLKRKSRTKISLPNPDDIQAMAVYNATREFWLNQSDSIEYDIVDPEIINLLISGIDMESEFDAEGLKTRYNAKVFALLKDRTEISYHIVLEWSAIELVEEQELSIFLMSGETSSLYRELAK